MTSQPKTININNETYYFLSECSPAWHVAHNVVLTNSKHISTISSPLHSVAYNMEHFWRIFTDKKVKWRKLSSCSLKRFSMPTANVYFPVTKIFDYPFLKTGVHSYSVVRYIYLMLIGCFMYRQQALHGASNEHLGLENQPWSGKPMAVAHKCFKSDKYVTMSS
jgi:hypothetical protein